MRYIDGDLYWGKVKVKDIAKLVGTPLYIYNYDVIMRAFKKVDNAFEGIEHILCYALKANSNLFILKMISQWGYGTEVVSGGELLLALKAGFKPEKIVFSGSGKSETEIEYGIKNNILLFNAESWKEILIINKISKKYKKIQKILIRINPDINPETHRYTTTGLKGEKFGIEWKKVPEILTKTKLLSNVKTVGIHIHLGSQIVKKEPFIMCSNFIKKFIKTAESSGIKLKYINIGGGLGIDYENDFPISDKVSSKKEKALAAKEWADTFTYKNNWRDKILIIEPGRFIMAKGGIIVTKILYKKRSFGKNFYIVDAGMNDFIRPSLYNAYHNIIPLQKRGEKQINVDVVGPICESGDFFAKNRNLPVQKNGDLLAILSAGAYGRCFSSNYNSRLRIPEILIKNNKIAVIRYKESANELINNQPIETIWIDLKKKQTTKSIKNKNLSIPFGKFSATGNDFIIIDNRENILKGLNLRNLFSYICQRKTSVGADGVIVIEKEEEKYRVSFYNPDGSTAESCGNGLRVLALFLMKYNTLFSEQIIESKDGIHEIKFQGNKPKVRMFIFKKSFKEKTLLIDNEKIKGYIINSGVPHFVILSKNIEDPKLMDTAKKIRFNSVFAPSGTNVDFIKKIKTDKIMIRTYERGVEAETLSCGTGAVAAYYIARKILKLKSPIKVITKGGELIISEEKGKIFLSGEVKEVYQGVFNLADIRF